MTRDYKKLSYKEIYKFNVKEEEEGHRYMLFYRKISVPIIKFLLPTKVTPDQLTYFTLFLGFVTAYAYYTFHPIWGAILFNLGVAFDMVDGGIARIKGITTKKGHMLDCIVGRLHFFMLTLGITFGLYLHYNSVELLILGFVLFVVTISRYVNRSLANKFYSYDSAIQNKKERVKGKNKYVTK